MYNHEAHNAESSIIYLPRTITVILYPQETCTDIIELRTVKTGSPTRLGVTLGIVFGSIVLGSVLLVVAGQLLRRTIAARHREIMMQEMGFRASPTPSHPQQTLTTPAEALGGRTRTSSSAHV
jgi:hypothetical protein